MTIYPAPEYDAFISYSLDDKPWVEANLLPALAEAHIRVCSPDTFDPGRPIPVNTEIAIAQSRKIVLVLTPNWLEDGWTEFQQLLMQSRDPAGLNARIVPLIVEPCSPPARISMLTPLDFTDPAARERSMPRLLRVLKARVFISYKHLDRPDVWLANRIRDQIKEAGYDIFIDQELRVGQDWARTLEQRIEASDFVIVLLSEASVQSEMVVKEVEHAYWHHQRTGKAHLLPVRINYDGALPYPLSTYLDALHYAEWRSGTRGATRQLISQLLDVIGFDDSLPTTQAPTGFSDSNSGSERPPPPFADPRFIDSLASPGGALHPQDVLYVDRDVDRTLLRELGKLRGTTTTIRAPRQTGKSSLLIRGVDQAKQRGSTAVFVDLQPIDHTYLESSDLFLRHLADVIVDSLELEASAVERVWQRPIGAPNKITDLMKDYVLKQIQSKIILAIDEADHLVQKPVSDIFFGLLRSWHNNRALNDIWQKLDILMVISTEPHLLISDFTQSPFNVGTTIELQDFDEEQVRELNARYRTPLERKELVELYALLNGHPFLTSKALYKIVTEETTWEKIKKLASTDRSPFSDHLKRYWWMLDKDRTLIDALRSVVDYGRCSDHWSFHRLSRAGLLKGEHSGACSFRCKLYEDYFGSRV